MLGSLKIMKDTLVYVEHVEIQNSSMWLSLLLNINDWLNLEMKLNLEMEKEKRFSEKLFSFVRTRTCVLNLL